MSVRSATELYEDDFFAWTQLQAKELRRFAQTRPNVPLDLGHIAEEVADLGKNQRDSLRSWTRRVIEHLILLQHSPARDTHRIWTAEIVNLRSEIHDRLTPTLQRDLKRRLPLLYDRARRDLQSKLAPFGEGDVVDRLPKDCPYTLDQVLGEFWPHHREQPGQPARI